MLTYHSVEELITAANEACTSIGDLVLKEQCEALSLSEAQIWQRMDERLSVMEASVRAGMNPDLRSTSGLTGGDAWKMKQYAKSGGITGGFIPRAISRALAVSEYNAAMGRIVAAPTAGSCGILPGCLISLLEENRVSRESVILSMFTASAFGMVIANRASVSGAEGGCQAECGSAAGMAAAALTELMGGSPQAAADACASALSNQLGLVCDPVAGLVEIPCIKRNVAGIMIAFSSAEMALAGIHAEIPVDEVIDAMRTVGNSLPCSLRETAQGGLAATPTGQKLAAQVFG